MPSSGGRWPALTPLLLPGLLAPEGRSATKPVHVAFWVCIALGIPLLDWGIGYERRMLQSLSTAVPILAVLAIGTALLRWINVAAAKDVSNSLLFEESPTAAVFLLDLNRDSLPLDAQSPAEP